MGESDTEVIGGTGACDAAAPWAAIIHAALVAAGIRQAAYVPDAGLARLIEMLRETADVKTVSLTTEEEGVALCAGAWLGGERAVLLMQSSGVGNCVNMFSLLASCRFPFLAVVTMRGEWAEFNPWQIPMGRATPQAFEMMGVRTLRVDSLAELADTAAAAVSMAFDSDQQIAILLSQRLLGRKDWGAQ
jgi:sulfopyruvate decarboxylase alpha subunit